MDVTSGHDHAADLHHRLVYETDPLIRAGLHLELATMAVADGRFESAARHFREALLLDTKLERAREGLQSLGEKLHAPVLKKHGAIRSLLHRIRHPRGE